MPSHRLRFEYFTLFRLRGGGSGARLRPRPARESNREFSEDRTPATREEGGGKANVFQILDETVRILIDKNVNFSHDAK